MTKTPVRIYGASNNTAHDVNKGIVGEAGAAAFTPPSVAGALTANTGDVTDSFGELWILRKDVRGIYPYVARFGKISSGETAGLDDAGVQIMDAFRVRGITAKKTPEATGFLDDDHTAEIATVEQMRTSGGNASRATGSGNRCVFSLGTLGKGEWFHIRGWSYEQTAGTPAGVYRPTLVSQQFDDDVKRVEDFIAHAVAGDLSPHVRETSILIPPGRDFYVTPGTASAITCEAKIWGDLMIPDRDLRDEAVFFGDRPSVLP